MLNWYDTWKPADIKTIIVHKMITQAKNMAKIDVLPELFTIVASVRFAIIAHIATTILKKIA